MINSVCIGGKQGNANADADFDVNAFNLVRLANSGGQLIRNRRRRFGVFDPGEKHDKLVASDTGHRIAAPQPFLDALGDTFAAQLESMAGMDAAALIADRNDKYMRIGDNGLD